MDVWQAELTRMILEYQDSGFMDDLRDQYFKRNRCAYQSGSGQLQGKAEPMNFDQHAGLYLLLVVGIVVCILLMFAEHATFKWMVSYWRRKPNKSFWKSPSMMFWSQVCRRRMHMPPGSKHRHRRRQLPTCQFVQ